MGFELVDAVKASSARPGVSSSDVLTAIRFETKLNPNLLGLPRSSELACAIVASPRPTLGNGFVPIDPLDAALKLWPQPRSG